MKMRELSTFHAFALLNSNISPLMISIVGVLLYLLLKTYIWRVFSLSSTSISFRNAVRLSICIG